MEENIKNQPISVVQSTDESFARALSITEEREKELDRMMDNCHAETTTYPDALKMLSETMNSKSPQDYVNEIAYCCFHMGAFAESQRSKHKLLYKLLGE